VGNPRKKGLKWTKKLWPKGVKGEGGKDKSLGPIDDVDLADEM
jgi:hypothetical protein